MHNLITNFEKLFRITKSYFQDSFYADNNYHYYPNKPEMRDREAIVLSIHCDQQLLYLFRSPWNLTGCIALFEYIVQDIIYCTEGQEIYS